MTEQQTLDLNPDGPPDLSHIIPDLQALAVPMDILVLDPENARDHDPRNIKVVGASMVAFGQRTPLTVNKKTNLIEKGNGTYMAAQLLDWKYIAVVWADDDEHTAMAYSLADNRSSDLSRMNYQQAGKNMRALKAVNHPILEIMYEEEEALPLYREEFQPAPISEDNFDTGILRGRPVKVTAAERLAIDKAVELCRAKSPKALKEGGCLEIICNEYLAASATASEAVFPVDQTMEQIVEEMEEILSLD